MIVVITGSRSITSYETVCAAFDACSYKDDISVLLSGHQKGVYINGKWMETVDLLAERWAKERKISVIPFPADWNKGGTYNPRAGFERNAEMVLAAKELSVERNEDWFCLAIWDEKSTGTKNCFRGAKASGGEVIIYSSVASRVIDYPEK